jgi:hypothetical protein
MGTPDADMAAPSRAVVDGSATDVERLWLEGPWATLSPEQNGRTTTAPNEPRFFNTADTAGDCIQQYLDSNNSLDHLATTLDFDRMLLDTEDELALTLDILQSNGPWLSDRDANEAVFNDGNLMPWDMIDPSLRPFEIDLPQISSGLITPLMTPPLEQSTPPKVDTAKRTKRATKDTPPKPTAARARQQPRKTSSATRSSEDSSSAPQSCTDDVDVDNDIEIGAPQDTTGESRPSRYAVEARYRTKLRDKIWDLKDAVPTLKAKMDGTADAPGATPPGLKPARNLKKSTVFIKTVEYIKYLEARNEAMAKRLEVIGQTLATDLP